MGLTHSSAFSRCPEIICLKLSEDGHSCQQRGAKEVSPKQYIQVLLFRWGSWGISDEQESARSGTRTQLPWVGKINVLFPTLYYSYLTSQGPIQPGDSQAWGWRQDSFPKTSFTKWCADSVLVSLVNDGIPLPAFLCWHWMQTSFPSPFSTFLQVVHPG